MECIDEIESYFLTYPRKFEINDLPKLKDEVSALLAE